MALCTNCNTELFGGKVCYSCGVGVATSVPSSRPEPPIQQNVPQQNQPQYPPQYQPQQNQPQYQPQYQQKQPDASKKIAAGLCGIFLGALGIHKFILGYKAEGLIMLLITIFTFGLAGFIFGLIGLVEGIIYLTKSDQEFINTYVVGKRGWF